MIVSFPHFLENVVASEEFWTDLRERFWDGVLPLSEDDGDLRRLARRGPSTLDPRERRRLARLSTQAWASLPLLVHGCECGRLFPSHRSKVSHENYCS